MERYRRRHARTPPLPLLSVAGAITLNKAAFLHFAYDVERRLFRYTDFRISPSARSFQPLLDRIGRGPFPPHLHMRQRHAGTVSRLRFQVTADKDGDLPFPPITLARYRAASALSRAFYYRA